jgi:N-acetyl-anhydromuramyl-L-alanine amidase AmpD
VDRDGVSRRRVLLGGFALAGAATVLVAPGEAWAVDAPPIIDCAGWGARPNSGVVSVWNQRPVRIMVHHTATPNTQDVSRAAADDLARGIQNFHMDNRNWIDSGQHFTISRGGFVLEGRRRSLEVLRTGKRQVEGAHCTGQNVEAVGIENEGTYGTDAPPAAQWDRLRAMCAYICQQYRVAPTEIVGHRDFKDTACPGDALYGMLPALRTEVAGVLGQQLTSLAARRVAWPLARYGDQGAVVQSAQHLLRAVGLVDVVADGRFDQRTVQAVRRFQTVNATEEVNGILGGESWPLLAAAAPTDHQEVGLALRAVSGGGQVRVSTVTGAGEWQRLLDAAAAR